MNLIGPIKTNSPVGATENEVGNCKRETERYKQWQFNRRSGNDGKYNLTGLKTLIQLDKIGPFLLDLTSSKSTEICFSENQYYYDHMCPVSIG